MDIEKNEINDKQFYTEGNFLCDMKDQFNLLKKRL